MKKNIQTKGLVIAHQEDNFTYMLTHSENEDIPW